jgi:YHS domain-containing protein
MRRITWTSVAIAALNVTVAGMPVQAEDRPPAPNPATLSSTAKIGEQVPCAIDGMEMALEADTPSAEYHGKTYYFCSNAEKQQFLKDSEHYAQH